MSNSNSLNLTDSTEWEEICEWNVIADNEEAELARRLTVRPVTSHGIGIFSPAIANESGSSSDNNDDDDDDADETYEYVETYPKATFANILKSGLDSKQQVSTRHPKRENHVNLTLPTPVSSEEDEKESTLDTEGKRGTTRRANDQISKIHDQRLYKKLVSREEIETSFSPGDNNRNEEFMLLKAAKKAMKKKRRTKRAE